MLIPPNNQPIKMTITPDNSPDVSKLSEENIKNFSKDEQNTDGKKWVMNMKIVQCKLLLN